VTNPSPIITHSRCEVAQVAFGVKPELPNMSAAVAESSSGGCCRMHFNTAECGEEIERLQSPVPQVVEFSDLASWLWSKLMT
jgi:hypothetical protein